MPQNGAITECHVIALIFSVLQWTFASSSGAKGNFDEQVVDEGKSIALGSPTFSSRPPAHLKCLDLCQPYNSGVNHC